MEVSERLEKLKILQNKCRIAHAMWKNDLIDVGEFTYGRPIVLQWDKHTRLKIGKFCSIGANVQIYLGGEHHTEWITTYPFDVLMGEAETPSKGNVTIGNDVWLGNNVTILSGVTIGDGAVIAAGSVVTKDVHQCEMVAGNPARQKKILWQKFGAVEMEWWDWPLEKIAEAVPYLMSDFRIPLDELHKRWEAEHND
jgi:acetyltransferase-like isoleucine patch superfamily enzyme